LVRSISPSQYLVGFGDFAFLKNCDRGILLATLYLLVLVLLAILSDPLLDSLFLLLARHKHIVVFDFDPVHQFLIESLVLLALRHKNVPNDVCKLLVVVELGEKDVLFRHVLPQLQSHGVERVDEESFD
jgi:hypothetical protein